MNSADSALGVIALLLIIMIIDIIGLEKLPQRVRLELQKTGSKLARWRRENPIVVLGFISAPGKKQRQDAILDWLGRAEDSLRNGGQGLW